ncbi:transcriptional protein SWT1 [Drosophila tropicalis]|uniref:transcriptional protein SWT1 n=1 Tax=Drosophila tropicalis TaxID=46794 RepID=UPI0035AC002D
MDSSSDEDPYAQLTAPQKLKFKKNAFKDEKQQKQQSESIVTASSSSSNNYRRQCRSSDRVSGSKNLAQDRLKRLQSHLKEKERGKSEAANNKSTRSHHHHQRSSISSRLANTKPSRNLRSSIRNAWEKPQALIDASNRVKKSSSSISSSSSSANERLRQLRLALQQQQQHQQQGHQKQKEVKGEHFNRETNNNKNKSPQNAARTEPEVEPEPMDWEDDDVSMAILQSLQREPGEQDLPARRLDHMYFILDTNVLIHNLSFVKDLPKLVLNGLAGSMIFIPYIVIKELDRLKAKHSDSEINRVAAIRAIHFLNAKFDESRDIQAQSALDEADHLIDVDTADDSILNCCLQLKEQVPNSMLLTNDNNLRLKANATSIRVSCKSDLMSEYPDIFDT